MNEDIKNYNKNLPPDRQAICDFLANEIQKGLPQSENKVWHGSPVWFLQGNPVAGYSSLKNDVQLLFWSGQSFNEPGLKPEGTFKAAQVRITNLDQINSLDLQRWLKKAQDIQWDYKNIIKRKGKLEKL